MDLDVPNNKWNSELWPSAPSRMEKTASGVEMIDIYDGHWIINWFERPLRNSGVGRLITNLIFYNFGI